MRQMPIVPSEGKYTRDSLAEELAHGLPKWIGWLPGLWAIGQRRFSQWKAGRRVESKIALRMIEIRVSATEVDQGAIDFGLALANFSKHRIEVDTVAVYGLGVGSSNLERKIEKGQVSGDVAAGTVGLVSFSIDLPAASIRAMIRGINDAVNAKCSPGADVRLNAALTCWAKHKRFHLPIDIVCSSVRSNISSDVIASVVGPNRP